MRALLVTALVVVLLAAGTVALPAAPVVAQCEPGSPLCEPPPDDCVGDPPECPPPPDDDDPEPGGRRVRSGRQGQEGGRHGQEGGRHGRDTTRPDLIVVVEMAGPAGMTDTATAREESVTALASLGTAHLSEPLATTVPDPLDETPTPVPTVLPAEDTIIPTAPDIPIITRRTGDRVRIPCQVREAESPASPGSDPYRVMPAGIPC
jgi:hypothetical protein